MTRLTCPVCHTPLVRCFCDLVVKVASEVEVIIWQHPSEAGHAKGTAPLLSRCLTNSQLIIAETLDPQEFEQATGTSSRQLHLLFPGDGSRPSEAIFTPTPTSNPAAGNLRLLALDGTWRKARKLLYLNPWLTELPKFELSNPNPSRYSIRKAEKPGQLSTLEAVCAAISQAESCSKNSQPILEAFDQYLIRLTRHRPR